MCGAGGGEAVAGRGNEYLGKVAFAVLKEAVREVEHGVGEGEGGGAVGCGDWRLDGMRGRYLAYDRYNIKWYYAL